MEASEDDQQQIQLNILIDLVLNICSTVVRINVKGIEEFAHVLADLGIQRAQQETICEVFQLHYLDRMKQINNAYENQDEVEDQVEVNQKLNKKFPLNLGAQDEQLVVMNPRLVDVDWQVIHTLSSKNLNKVFQPRFLITLTFLTQ